MGDPRFSKAVIYMCAHNAEGAMGLVINKLVDGLTFPDLLKQLKIQPTSPKSLLNVFIGGPVEQARGFVLHSTEYLQDATLRVSDTVGLTATIDVLRDIAEDAERDRLYLPSDLLDRHGISTREPSSVMIQPGLPAVCEDLSRIAQQHYADAEAAMEACSRKNIRPAVLMMQIYRRVLEGLIKREWTQLDTPVKVSKLTKIWILLRYGLF